MLCLPTDPTVARYLSQVIEENLNTGSSRLASTQIDLASSSGFLFIRYPNLVGIRYTLNIPQGATIVSASVQFKSHGIHSMATQLQISAHFTANAPAFTWTSTDLSRRVRTAAVNWEPPMWWSNEEGPNQQTPDLSSILQTLVNLPGWAAGNAMLLIFEEYFASVTAHRAGLISQGAPLTIEYIERMRVLLGKLPTYSLGMFVL